MFGEEYFKTRKRLTDVVLRVLTLAEKTGAEKQPLLDNDITKGLSNPFLFVVCGEVNAGKSSLLNGLFGQDVCKINVLPETDRVQWYRYGEKNHDKKIKLIEGGLNFQGQEAVDRKRESEMAQSQIKNLSLRSNFMKRNHILNFHGLGSLCLIGTF